MSLLFADPLEKIEPAVRTKDDGTKTIEVEIFITVSYRIDGGTDTHVTHHAYSMLNVPVPSTIAERMTMELRRMPFLGGIVDGRKISTTSH
jgi:hypothetical protein